MGSLTLTSRQKHRRLPQVDVPVIQENDELRRFSESIKEHLRMYEGDSGAPKERFVTLEELEHTGLVTTKVQSGFASIDKILGEQIATVPSVALGVGATGRTGARGASTFRELDDTEVSGIKGGQGIVWNGNAFVPIEFPALNLDDAVRYDMMYFDGGDWRPTDEELQWNPDDDLLQLANAHSINWLNDFDATQAFLNFAPIGDTGDTIGHIISELTTGVSTTSGTYVDVTGASVAYASMDANTDYVVFVRAYVGNSTSTTTPLNGVRLTKADVELAGSEMLYESPSTVINDVGKHYHWAGIVSSGASGDLQLEHLSGNGTDTVFANNVTIMMIKVVDLILNTNVFHDTDTGLVELDDGNFPAAWVSSGAGVTIGDGLSDWLVFGVAQVEDFLTGSNKVGLRVNDGTATKPGATQSEADRSGTLSLGFMQLWSGVASGTTLTVELQTSGFPCDKTYASIIAIRLNAFRDYQSHFDPASIALGTGPTELATVVFTALATASYGFISGANGPNAGNQGASDFIRYSVDGGADSTVAGSETQTGISETGLGGSEEPHWTVSADQSLTSGDVIDANLVATDASTAQAWTDRFLVAFQWVFVGDEVFDVGNAGYVTRMRGLTTRFYDTDLTDYVEFNHDGTDFVITGFQTTDFKLEDISLHLTHTAAEPDDHAFEIDTDAAGFGDVKALDIDYITGAIADGQDEAVILINIDEFLATGGDVNALEVLATEGSANIFGLLAGALVNPIEQLSGVFINATLVDDDGVEETTALSSGGAGNISIFAADDDFVIVGSTARFEEIEFILATGASGAGIKPTFEFSDGVGSWATFTPTDGTNAMRNTGVMEWLDSAIPSWAVGNGSSEFLIRITRTRNSMATTPIADLVRIAATVEFKWDKLGDLTVNDIVAAKFGGIVSANLTDKVAAETITGDWDFTNAGSTFAGSVTSIAVTDESVDTTTFPVFVTSATGNQLPRTGTNLTFDSSAGDLVATKFAGITAANLLDKTATETITGVWTFTTADGLIVSNTSPEIHLRETDATADEGNWIIRATGDGLKFQTASDAAPTNGAESFWTCLRTGTVADEVRVKAAILSVRGGGSLKLHDSSNVDDVSFSHDGTDFNIVGTFTTDINITGITAIAAGTVDADFDAITGTSYGGITQVNLVDKTAAETISGAWTFTAAILEIASSAPTFNFNETDEAVDEKRWRIDSFGSSLRFATRTDVDGSGNNLFLAARTGTAIDLLTIGAPTTVSGALIATSYGGITEANLVDKTATETISGNWEFTGSHRAQGLPNNTQNGDYTLVLSDAGKQIVFGGTAGKTHTIPANSSVAYPIGTVLTWVNRENTNSLAIAITTDILKLANSISTGTRTLARNGIATCRKALSTTWIIEGPGVS